MSDREWRPVVGYEGFCEVSSDGLVRSVPRVVTQFSARAGKIVPLRRSGRLLAQNVSKRTGRPAVCLSRDGGCRTFQVQVLVCIAFHGPRPDGMQVCHNDGDPLNNRSSNLRWGTAKQNQADRLIHGTDLRGTQVGTAKYTPAIAAAIKAGEISSRAARERYGVSRSHFHRIRKGESWAHLAAAGVSD